MRPHRLLVPVVASVLAVPLALGLATSASAACPGTPVVSDEEAFLASLAPPLPEEPLTLASPAATKGAGGVQPSEKESPADCDWFDITCSDGRTEECCGSVNSCLGYCAEYCGEPCIYIPE